MFLKQEKPEMDDFERKTNFCSKAKSSQSIFAYPFVSEKKTCIFYWRGIGPHPPLADAKNARFFLSAKPICTTESFEINAFHFSHMIIEVA